jgi:hypothetical protein
VNRVELLKLQDNIKRGYRAQLAHWMAAGAPIPPVKGSHVGFLAAQLLGSIDQNLKLLGDDN